MKLTIRQEPAVSETEITILRPEMNPRLQKLADQIRQYGFSLTAYQDSREFQIPLESVCFFDSADGKTFAYQEKEVYECRETLTALESKLRRTSFLRISKNCILNLCFLKYVEPLYNHRLTAVLTNGEKLVITRSYIDPLKTKLKGASL